MTWTSQVRVSSSLRFALSGSILRCSLHAQGGALYAIAMGHNPQQTRIGALSPSGGMEPRKIARVELLGSTEPLHWTLGADGLASPLPDSGQASTQSYSRSCLREFREVGCERITE